MTSNYNDKRQTNPNVAIVYHYIAHYRLPIFRELTASKRITYSIISGKAQNLSIKTIDDKLANIPLEKGGLRWHFVKNIWLLKGQFLWQAGLLDKIRRDNYDAIIFLGNIYYISTWIAMIYLKLKKKRIYLWTHGITSNEDGIKWLIRKAFYGLSDGLLLYGEKAKVKMIERGFSYAKLHVIYNSLDYENQVLNRNSFTKTSRMQLKKKYFSHFDLPLIIFVGRLTSYKKLHMIIQASKLLFNKNKPFNTLFVGEGAAREELKKLVMDNGLNNYFYFYGACYNEYRLAELLWASDICISPGEVGLTAITALGYGTPVITHSDFNNQMPEYEAITPGINGLLFKHDSVEDLAEKIINWLEHVKDLSRSEIRENCFKIVDQVYNPKNQAAIINSIVTKE